MKKTILLIIISITFSNAGVWEKLQSFGDEVVPSNSYDVDAKGWNFRVYEFIPKNAQEKLCIIVASDRNGIQVECFDRKINK
jgi:hypothetical protein